MRRNPSKATLTVEQVRELFDYDPASGTLMWKHRADRDKTWNTRFAGKEAGYRQPAGYIEVTIDYVQYAAHQIAYLYMTGEYPANEIDHENGDTTDNSWSNLRAATRLQNGKNRGISKNNKSGYKGVCWHRGAWMATIEVSGKSIYLGRFQTAESAHAAYCEAAIKHHGEFARFA